MSNQHDEQQALEQRAKEIEKSPIMQVFSFIMIVCVVGPLWVDGLHFGHSLAALAFAGIGCVWLSVAKNARKK